LIKVYDHLLFADITGASAVFEWAEGELHIIRKGQDENYQVITNYWLSNPSLGGYPCDRYNTVADQLQSHTSAAISKKNIFYDYWILWISGICILAYITLSLVKKIKRENGRHCPVLRCSLSCHVCVHQTVQHGFG
jgi:hypothetical protein